MKHLLRQKSRILITASFCVLLLWPHQVQAFSLMDITNPVNWVLNMLQMWLDAVHYMLVVIVAALGGILDTVLKFDPSYGGPAIYAVWKIFRDICNSLFIVFFVLIAFATIFKTVSKKLSPFYYESALLNVIVAAILINFSLPIGQTIVWTGNQASALVAGLMSEQSISEMLFTTLKVKDRSEGASPTTSLTQIPDFSTPLNKQSQGQQIATKNFTGNVKTVYDNCMKGNQSSIPGKCLSVAMSLAATQNAKDPDVRAGQTNADIRSLSALWNEAVSTAKSIAGMADEWFFGDSYQVRISRIINLMINNFLLFILILLILFTILIMVVRIPYIWLLLASSSGTFFAYAIPGKDTLGKWFNNLIGWCLFGPLFLFAIYVGMFLLSQGNTLIASLSNAPFFDAIFGVFLFYFLAFTIFLGGAKLAWDTAFHFSDSLKNRVTSLGKTLGISPDTNFGLTTSYNAAAAAAKAAAKYSGATAAYEGMQTRIKEKYEDKFIKPQKDWEEDVKARFQGGKAQESLRIQRINEQKKSNKDKNKLEADLRSDLAASNPEKVRIAAFEQLLENGDLNPAEMSAYVAAASSISPTYGRLAQDKIDKKLSERGKEKKFKTAAEVTDALSIYAPAAGDTPAIAAAKTKKREAILSAVEKNQPLIASELGAVWYPGKTPSEIVKGNFSALQTKDIISLVERLEDGRLIKDTEFEKLIASKNRKLADHLNLMSSTTDPMIQAHILNYMVNQGVTPRATP